MAAEQDLNRKMGWRCPYGKCEGNGFLYNEETNTATDCPCRPQMIAATRATSLRARVPDRFRNVSFDAPPITDMPPPVVRKVRRFVTNLDANLEAGHGLWLEGPSGTGKTSLATLVSLAARDAGRSFAIYSVPRILNELRRTFDDDSTVGNLELIDRLTAVELLQLDDLGAERTNPWVLEQLYALIDARYEAQRSVIVTTNLGRDELVEQVGARVVSRLSEMCDPIPLYGEDRRRAPGEWATTESTLRPPSGPAPSAHRGVGAPAYAPPQAPQSPSAHEEEPSWNSPAAAANLHRPEWPTPEDPPVYARPLGHRNPSPEAPAEHGVQGSTRRGPSDA